MRFLDESEAQDGFKRTKLLSSIAASGYDTISTSVGTVQVQYFLVNLS